MSSDYFFRENPPSNYPGSRWYSLPETTDSVLLRFLPSLKGTQAPGKLVSYHYNVFGHKKLFCLSTYGMDCPLCDTLENLEASIWYREERSKLKAVARSYFNILLLRDPADHRQYSSDMPCILGISGREVYDWLSTLRTNSTAGDITDIHLGSTVQFQCAYHKGHFTKTVSFDRSPLSNTQEGIDRILSRCSDLDKIWPNPDLYTKNLMVHLSSRIASLHSGSVR